MPERVHHIELFHDIEIIQNIADRYELDNSVYDMSVTNGIGEEIIAAIGDADNWNGNNNRVSLPPDDPFNIEGEEGSIIEAPVWVRTIPMTC